jgi:hypothetical protein
MNCPLCNKNIDKPTGIWVDKNKNFYQCCKFYVAIDIETNQVAELYLCKSPIVIYLESGANYPSWSVQINQKITYKEMVPSPLNKLNDN